MRARYPFSVVGFALFSLLGLVEPAELAAFFFSDIMTKVIQLSPQNHRIIEIIPRHNVSALVHASRTRFSRNRQPSEPKIKDVVAACHRIPRGNKRLKGSCAKAFSVSRLDDSSERNPFTLFNARC